MGQRLRPAFTIGKAGLTPAAKRKIRQILDSGELVKIRIPPQPGGSRKEFAGSLARDLDAELVGVVGRSVLLYAAHPRSPTIDAEADPP